MKEIEELNLPDNVRYAETHEWAKPEGDVVRVGISDYAQEQLGALTFVELPNLGDVLRRANNSGSWNPPRPCQRCSCRWVEK